jgi:hypothetical protein
MNLLDHWPCSCIMSWCGHSSTVTCANLYAQYKCAPCGIVVDTKQNNFQRRRMTLNTYHTKICVKQSHEDSRTGDCPMVMGYADTCEQLSKSVTSILAVILCECLPSWDYLSLHLEGLIEHFSLYIQIWQNKILLTILLIIFIINFYELDVRESVHHRTIRAS